MGKIHFHLRDIHQIGTPTNEFLIHPEHCPGLQEHQIILAGISQGATGFRFARTKPSMNQLLVCLRGLGRVWIDGGWKTCGAGMAYLTPPNCFHAYESRPRWDVGWIMFAKESSILPLTAPKLVETDPRPLEHILHGLHLETSSRRDAAMLDLWGNLLHRQASRIVGTDHSSRLWRLWQTVQMDLASDWTLNKLARVAGLGPENLRRICLHETGRSPMQHLTHLRMAYAASLLTTGRKIDDVARMAGYTNAFAFSTAFKRVMHRPPSRFRG